MSLRSKIILMLAAVALVWASADKYLLNRMVSGSFEDLGWQEAEASLDRIEARLDDQVTLLTDQARLLAALPATQTFLEQGDPSFVPQHLMGDALENSGLDMLFFLNRKGDVLWGRVIDGATGGELRLKEFRGTQLLPTHHLLRHSLAERRGNLLPTDGGLLLTSVFPVLDKNTDERDPREVVPLGEDSLGVIMVGRFLDSEQLEAMSIGLANSLDVNMLGESQLDEREEEIVRGLASNLEGETTHVELDDGGVLHAYRVVRSVRDVPNILLSTTLADGVMARGKQATDYLALSTVGTAIMFFLVLLRILQYLVISPLAKLTGVAVSIGRTDDTSQRIRLDRKDEVGVLAREFDSMLGKLADSRRLLVKTARQAGMSEIATGVLHNVGNVLNSVNVSANLVRKEADKLSVNDMRRMLAVLDEHADDLGRFLTEDKRGQHVLPLLKELIEELEGQRGKLKAELTALSSGIDHMADLVRAQQSYAGTKGVFEKVCLADEVEAAIKMCDQAYGDEGDVNVRVELDRTLPAIEIDRQKFMEIMVNLIQNARQALAASETSQREIIVSTRRSDHGTACVEVTDNGPGIDEGNLAKIFHHGFTTKADGHGFGLHVSANAATEMNATLSASSQGLGHGATFLLEFPMQEETVPQAA